MTIYGMYHKQNRVELNVYITKYRVLNPFGFGNKFKPI